jgi:hypothetical protein
MTVPELREAINAKMRTADGSALRLPNGVLVSKGKKADLEALHKDLTIVVAGLDSGEIVDEPISPPVPSIPARTVEMVGVSRHDMILLIDKDMQRTERRIRKLLKRRQRPNNRRLIFAARNHLLRCWADIEIVNLETERLDAA